MIKKVISFGLAVVTMAGVILSSAISAEAKYTSTKYYEKSMQNFSTYVYGDYSRMYASPGYTGVMSTNSLYDNSYKRAYYNEYIERSGSYIVSKQEWNEGFDEVVISNVKSTVSASVAERYHSGYVHLTASTNSSVKDSMICDIYKDTEASVNS